MSNYSPNPIPADELLVWINQEPEFKAAKVTNAIWDRCVRTAKDAYITLANFGDGMEEVIRVPTGSKDTQFRGEMLYRGPFAVEQFPDYKTLLLFFCEDAIFIKNRD